MGRLIDNLSFLILTFPRPRSYIVKKNHISLAVSEIIQYRQTDKDQYIWQFSIESYKIYKKNLVGIFI